MVAVDGGARSQRNLNDRSSNSTSLTVGNTQSFVCFFFNKGKYLRHSFFLKSTRDFSTEK